MTAAQRLRLVLALGVVNLVLATVALGFGISGLSTPATTAGGLTPDIAFASPVPTGPAQRLLGSGATPSLGQPGANLPPGLTGEPSTAPPTALTTNPSATPTQSTEPSPTPSVAPSPSPTVPTSANASAREPEVVIMYPTKPTQAPSNDTAGDPATPDDDGHDGHVAQPPKPPKPPTDHAREDHHPKAHRHHRHGGHHQRTGDR